MTLTGSSPAGWSQPLWSRTAMAAPDLPPFASDETYDVVVVGAGITGCSAALHLASAFPSVQRLGRALLTVKRCLTAGCRMNRRKKHPNTYQLLLDATGPCRES